MKNRRKINFIAWTLLLPGLLLSSCSDDELFEKNTAVITETSDNISFGIIDNNSNQTGTRAVNGNNRVLSSKQYVLRSEDSQDTLCMRATVTDGFETESYQGQTTRAAQITDLTQYGTFGVLAYWWTNSKSDTEFLMYNEEVKNRTQGADNLWSSDNVYWWPGAEHKLQFIAYSPYNDPSLVIPEKKTAPSYDMIYTAPDNVKQQKDIVVAKTAEMNGDANQRVPLSFKHICTAVKFSTGQTMQAGRITNIVVKGVYNKGTYSTNNSTWTVDNSSVKNYTLEINKDFDGTANQEVTIAENTLMMVPQTLPEGATIEVTFVETLTSTTRVLTAPINGDVWPMGKTINYTLSITPSYELHFAQAPQPQDAHYVIYPITITCDAKLSGWTLTSNDPTNVTFVESGKFESKDLQGLVDAGYWLEGYNGTSTLTSTTKGDVKVYAFLKENATEADRNITLSLKPAGQGNYQAEKFSFSQYCPAWNNGIGVERIQDQDVPWGFVWNKDMKIKYNFGKGVSPVLASIYIKLFVNYPYVSSNWGGVFWDFTATIDFSKVGSLTTATDVNDGNKNTWELYTFNGLNDATALMEQIESWGGVPDKTLPTNPSEYAARTCAMKNKYRVEKVTDPIENKTVYRPVLDRANMVWYLPARDEAPNMMDNLAGDYWTSTAINNPGTGAYKYTAGGTYSVEPRTNSIHVRAVRKK